VTPLVICDWRLKGAQLGVANEASIRGSELRNFKFEIRALSSASRRVDLLQVFTRKKVDLNNTGGPCYLSVSPEFWNCSGKLVVRIPSSVALRTLILSSLVAQPIGAFTATEGMADRVYCFGCLSNVQRQAPSPVWRGTWGGLRHETPHFY
jgi:hypothetical protein